MATEEQQTSDETVRQSVAERAYALWESEGKPHGRDVDHWCRAEAEVGAAVNADPSPEPQEQSVASAKSSEKTAARRK